MSNLDPGQLAALVRSAAEIAPRVVVWTRQIAAVAAPTGDEHDRALLVQQLFRDEGLTSSRDPLHDVVVTIPGVNTGPDKPAVLVAAHLDTVFSRETKLNIRAEASRLYGPGVGDNSVGVASVLALPQMLASIQMTPAVDVLLTGNTGEEGLGNLHGIRAVMDANPRIASVIAVEGHNLGRITHVGVGSKRLRVTATGPGGHSWGDYGRPSAIHALAKLIAGLDDIPVSWNPKTTLNVGMIEGGISVNSIAPTASCLIDMRSVDAVALERLGTRVDRAIEAAKRHGVTFTTEVLGERPAGSIPVESPLPKGASDILSRLGITATFDASSTDANIALSKDIPAICIGMTSGGNVHREDEYIDVAPIATGLVQLGLIVLLAANLASAGS